MAFQIDVQLQGDYAVDAARLQAAAGLVLSSHQAHPETGLSIVITDDHVVRLLNRQYRGIDAPTDVLSFQADAPPVEIEGEPPYLGDLIIAFPYAAAQAAREGHALADSLALLVTHGTLHLLGYDHDNDTRRAHMWTAQEVALKALGIPLNIVPTLEGESHDDLA